MGYKVKIKNSTSDYKNKTCFLGISTSNPIYLDKDKVSKIIEWMEKKFRGSKILLIGDVLHTFNLNMFTEYFEMNIEDEKKKGNQILENLIFCTNDKSDFTIVEWNNVKNKLDVLIKRQELTKYYIEKSEFREEILSTARLYVNKKIGKGFNLRIPVEDAIDSSVSYLIEELSVFSYLIDKGFEVQLYFGTQLPLLKKIASGNLDLKTNLKNCIYIDANLKKI